MSDIPDEFITEARAFVAAEVPRDIRWQYMYGRHDSHAAVKAVARAIMAERGISSKSAARAELSALLADDNLTTIDAGA